MCRDDVPVRLGKGGGPKSRLMNTWSALSPSTERGIGKKLLKAYHRTRRDFPLVNFMVVYGVKQAGAALFLADIVRLLPNENRLVWHHGQHGAVTMITRLIAQLECSRACSQDARKPALHNAMSSDAPLSHATRSSLTT